METREPFDPYEHEDAFQAANICAGTLTDLAGRLDGASTASEAKERLEDCKVAYERVFEAFLRGVDWGRKNPAIAGDESA